MARSGATPSAAKQLLDVIERVVKLLGALLPGSKEEPDDKSDGASPPSKPPNELDGLASDEKDLETSMQEMRDDLGAFGKSVGAIVTGVIAALGYTRFNDIFPFPLGAPGWLGPATVAAAAVGLGATTFLIFRFFFAKRRILLYPPKPGAPWWKRDPTPLDEVTPHAAFWRREHKLVIQVTQPYAAEEGEASLWAVEEKRKKTLAQAHRDDPTGTVLSSTWKRAYRLERVVELALWEAAGAVLERRTRGAFGGPVAAVAILCAVGGIAFTFAAADWAKGRRTLPEQRIREAQACMARARTSTTESVTTLTVTTMTTTTITTITWKGSDTLAAACLADAKSALAPATTATTQDGEIGAE